MASSTRTYGASKRQTWMGNIFKSNKEVNREYRDHQLDFIFRAGALGVVRDGLEEGNIRFSWPKVAE